LRKLRKQGLEERISGWIWKIDGELALRKIELQSVELAEELQKHLLERRFAGAAYEKGAKSIEFPENMSLWQWTSLKSTVEKWAKGRRMEVIESLNVESIPVEPAEQVELPQSTQAIEAEHQDVDHREIETEAKKKLERLTPDTTEERYDYLQSKPLTELTDAEIEERLALAQRKKEKDKDSKRANAR